MAVTTYVAIQSIAEKYRKCSITKLLNMFPDFDFGPEIQSKQNDLASVSTQSIYQCYAHAFLYVSYCFIISNSSYFPDLKLLRSWFNLYRSASFSNQWTE